jgi:hypothetical protein
MTKLGDAINYLSDNTAAKAKDMVPALNRIGGTARQFGLTAVQASALAGAFIILGKAPEKAGTAINAMLSSHCRLSCVNGCLMSDPVGAVVGGIAIAATLVITNWESVKSFFMTIWQPIKPVWEAFGDWLGKF